MTTKEEKEQQDHEAQVGEQLAHARTIAKTLFVDKTEHTKATFALFELLDLVEDEEELAADVAKAQARAQAVFETDAPTAEEVFGTYSRMFNGLFFGDNKLDEINDKLGD